MRLEADHWSSCPPRTALELIPRGHVRPSAAYFQAGHLLLDRLTGALAQPTPARRPGRVLASQPHADQGKPGPSVALPARGEWPLPHQPTGRQEHDMARSIDFHDDLKLPAETIAQIAEDTRNTTTDRFGVGQIELYHNPEGKVYCLLEVPDEDAIRKHHATLGVPCGAVHQADSLPERPVRRGPGTAGRARPAADRLPRPRRPGARRSQDRASAGGETRPNRLATNTTRSRTPGRRSADRQYRRSWSSRNDDSSCRPRNRDAVMHGAHHGYCGHIQRERRALIGAGQCRPPTSQYRTSATRLEPEN
jgi:hypothetical protein